jgi:D-aminopeptidase
MTSRLDRVLLDLPNRYPGPGGAAAVIREGEVIARHAWGYANAERRIPFTPKTLFRICSITKQFVCALVLDAFGDPSALDGDVRARLPRLTQPAPTARDLCHNQSGLRDYWAVAMLHGAGAEQAFGDREAAEVIGGTRTLQFAPGTRYSYANQNFRLLADILAQRTDRSLAELLRTRIFARAGMETAMLAPDTRTLPDGTEGYEGGQAQGFRIAENRVFWTGDAGIAASLDDMIAWERFIDATRDDADGLYNRLSAPVTFADGRPATYGFGLGQGEQLGRPGTAHGGGLRGWRSHRQHSPADRISVVTMFNHLTPAHRAASDLFAAALDAEPPSTPPASDKAPDWLGAYREPETQLATRIDRTPEGVRLRFATGPDTLELQDDGAATGQGGLRLRPEADGLWMDRLSENQSTRLVRCPAGPAPDIAGRYACEELGAELTIEGAGGGVFYGAFSGFLGAGRMELIEPVAPDVWVLPCRRALDYDAPGDWTLAFQRDDAGRAVSLDVGCWLARRLPYRRQD